MDKSDSHTPEATEPEVPTFYAMQVEVMDERGHSWEETTAAYLVGPPVTQAQMDAWYHNEFMERYSDPGCYPQNRIYADNYAYARARLAEDGYTVECPDVIEAVERLFLDWLCREKGFRPFMPPMETLTVHRVPDGHQVDRSLLNKRRTVER